MKTLPFRLPFSHRIFSITGPSRDLSIMRSIEASDGYYEPHVMNVLGAFVRKGSVSIDIGANIGAISIALSALSRPSGKIYAFEASKLTYEMLIKNISNNCLANVESFNLALYDENRELEFCHLKDEPGGSFISATGEIADKNVEVATVTAVRLDDWVSHKQIDRIDLVKLDVEGAEARAIKGARKTLERFRPDLIMEFYLWTLKVFHNQDAKEFYNILKQIYPNIYSIDSRDFFGSLTKIERFVDLYSIMIRNAGLTDLFCTHRSDDEVRSKIKVNLARTDFRCEYLNRNSDGWSVGKYAEAVVIVDRDCFIEITLLVKLPFDRLPITVRIFYRDRKREVILDSSIKKRVRIPLNKGVNLIVVETNRTFSIAQNSHCKGLREFGVNFTVRKTGDRVEPLLTRLKYAARRYRQKLIRRLQKISHKQV